MHRDSSGDSNYVMRFDGNDRNYSNESVTPPREWANNDIVKSRKKIVKQTQPLETKTSSGGFAVTPKAEGGKFNLRSFLNDPKKRTIIIYVVQTVICLCLFVIIVVILYTVNPPITQKKEIDGWSSGKQNGVSVFVTATVAFVVAFGLCEVIRYVKF